MHCQVKSDEQQNSVLKYTGLDGKHSKFHESLSMHRTDPSYTLICLVFKLLESNNPAILSVRVIHKLKQELTEH